MASRVRRGHLGAALLSFLLLLNACSTEAKRGYALYSGDPASKPLDEVAQIATQFGAVNGRAIPEGVNRVEVLPGCYVVSLAPDWIFDENGAYAHLSTRGSVVNVDAEAGYLYVIDLQHGPAGVGEHHDGALAATSI